MGAELLLMVAVAIYVTGVAADPVTAGVRAGAAGAISAVARSVKAGYQSRRAAGKARRTQQHLARRAAWAAKDKAGKNVDPWGPVKLWLDDVFGEGGRAEAAAKAAGRALREAGATALQGYRDGKGNAHRGPAEPLSRAAARVAEKVASRVARHQQATTPKPTTNLAGIVTPATTAPNAGNETTEAGKPSGITEGNPMSQSTQALSSEAGLLPIADAMEAIVELIAQVQVQTETAQGLNDLSFPVDEKVAASIAALIEAAPDPGKLGAFAEAIPAFREAVQESITHLAGA